MLISHQYRFIFIKTRKTAGTSIEVDFSKIMSDSDIVTKINPAVTGHRPRNFNINGFSIYNHMSASELRRVIGDELFSEYYKFCVEREPVEKSISHYFMLKNSPEHNSGACSLTWENYISNEKFPVDHDKYLDESGRLIVDRIIRYEHLEADLAEVMKLLGISPFKITSRAKSGFRDANLDVSFEDKKIIYSCFQQSLKFTGYHLQ